MAWFASAIGSAVANPEKTAQSPMLFLKTNVGRCVTCNA